MARDVERISDHANGIVKDVEYEIKKNLFFSSDAHMELDKLLEIASDMIEKSYEALKDNDKSKAIEVIDLHNILYSKEKSIRKDHIKRIKDHTCDLESGLYYIDIVSHFTRIGDHTRNLIEKLI